MPSPQHDAIANMLAAQAQARPATPPTIQETRAGFAQMASLFPVPAGVPVER